MELTADEQTLLIVGVGYLFAVGIWLWSMSVRADVMLREVGELMDRRLWQELGAPGSFKSAMQDPERRWMRFVRSGDYRKRCGGQVIDLIDDFERRTNWMLIVLGLGAALILYRFWPLLFLALR
jgi:hypothetical protein